MSIKLLSLLLFAASATIAIISRADDELTTIQLKDKILPVSSLQLILEYEVQRKWLTCAQKSASALKSETDVKDWIALKGLRCARLAKNKTLIRKFLGEASGALGELKFPTARPAILRELSRNFQAWQDTDLGPLVKPAEAYTIWADKTDKDGRAKAFEILGQYFYAKKDLEAARQQFVLSLREKETRKSRERLTQLSATLSKTTSSVGGGDGEYEAPFNERIVQSLKKKDLLAQLDDYISYLVQFPGGRKIKSAGDKINEILSLMLDRDPGAFRDQIVRVLEKGSSSVLFDIERYLYRRSDFRDCATIGEQVLKQLGGLPQFLTAKCYELSGEYKKARDLFDSYLLAYPAADESGEARFRDVLLNYRLGQDPNVISIVEKYMRGAKNDKYDLWMRYWYVRSLQRSKNAQAIVQAKKIVSEYPVSFYGLLLNGQMKNQPLTADDVFELKEETPTTTAKTAPTEVETTTDADEVQAQATAPPPASLVTKSTAGTSKLALTPMGFRRWQRFKKLAGGGWLEEATKEAEELTLSIPSEDWMAWSQMLIENKIYLYAIRLSSQLFDRNPELRSFSLLQKTFPRVYEKDVVKDSERVKISPFLTWSLMRQESAYQKSIVSTSNAMGLMQLIGPTGDEVARDLKRDGFESSDDLFDTGINIQFGTSYLAKLVRQNDKCVPWALAAYNSGPTKVVQYLSARKLKQAEASKGDELWLLIDEYPFYETSFYVKAILRNVLIYKIIDQKKVEAGPDDWRTLVTD